MDKVVVSQIEETSAPGDNRSRLIASPKVTHNRHCQATLLRILPGHRFPKHVHPDSDDVIYVLKGRAVFTVGEEEMEVSRGELVVVPERIPHSAYNPTADDVECLVFQAPVPKYKFLE